MLEKGIPFDYTRAVFGGEKFLLGGILPGMPNWGKGLVMN